MRRRVLQEPHNSLQGIKRTKALARQTVYWPSINNNITNTVRCCEDCQRELPSLPRELQMSHAEPSRPFEVISMDLSTYANQQLLIAVDRFSSWPWVFQLGASPITRQITASLYATSSAHPLPKTSSTPTKVHSLCQESVKIFSSVGELVTSLRHCISHSRMGEQRLRSNS